MLSEKILHPAPTEALPAPPMLKLLANPIVKNTPPLSNEVLTDEAKAILANMRPELAEEVLKHASSASRFH